MRAALVTTRHAAQDDRIYYKQALSLAKRMEVVMIAPDDGELLSWPPPVRYRPLPRRRGLLGRSLSLVEAVREVRREQPDFCHVHDLDLVAAIPFLRLLTRAKIIYDSHEAYPEQFLTREVIPRLLRPSVARAVDFLEKHFVRCAHQVVTADKPTERSFAVTGVRANTVFNYPPLEIFETNETEVKAVKAKYADRVPIIYQGTMSADRGLFHMIDALSLIAKSEPAILLRLIGLDKPALKAEARARAVAKGVLGNIEIVEWVPHTQLAYHMKSSLIGLIPLQPTEKYKRNIPIKLFEYMACGLPVVAADVPSIAHFLSQTEAGVLYDSTRPEELARNVLELLADPERCGRMGQSGLAAVRDRWNWERMERELYRVYAVLGACLDEGTV